MLNYHIIIDIFVILKKTYALSKNV